MTKGRRKSNKDTELSFLEMELDDRIDVVHWALFGLGETEWDEAVRAAASALKDNGLVEYQRLRANGEVYKAVDEAIEEGFECDLFEQHRDGYVCAILKDAKDYETHHWGIAIGMVLHVSSRMDKAAAITAAAEWARENTGLEFKRLRSGGIIDRGLREAVGWLVEEGQIRRGKKGELEYKGEG